MNYKEKKEILLMFGSIDEHINCLLEELERWHRITDGEHVKKLKQLEGEINSEIDALITLRKTIEIAVMKLPDIRQRKILNLCYIGRLNTNGNYKRLKLWQIAKEMNYSVDTVSNLHREAIRNLKL